MTKNKCPYCNKILLNKNKYCNEYCENKYISFIESCNKTSKIFINSIITVCLSILFCSIISIQYKTLANSIFSITFIFLGIIMLFFPFTNPYTSEILGIKKTNIIHKILAVIVVLFGITY